MITKYIQSAIVRFDPLTKAKPARIFLSLIPPYARTAIKLDTIFLDKASTGKPLISVTFKDGNIIEADPTKTSIDAFVSQIDRYSEGLLLQEQLKN
ncbi:mitochondrial 54S ribosomal protein mL53 [Kockiozyma suomiensis]|uniref:mitochondrial 54S ribosomal protein mL53 n=1 Tax=Kockiozyma suomiensis TaxID=1337062 RepID=UPI003343E689